jgi:hypothetical protein
MKRVVHVLSFPKALPSVFVYVSHDILFVEMMEMVESGKF